jgi:DNA-binding transcriptional regulator GbsR (MarR family)
MKKNQKLELWIKDLEYLYQYIILNFNEVKFFKNLQLLITKKREEIYDFIKIVDKEYINKTPITYVTADDQHNSNIFDADTFNILHMDINREFLEFLRIVIDNKKLFKRITDTYNQLFRSKWIMFAIFAIVLYGIIYILWWQFLNIDLTWVRIDMSSVKFFYYNALPIVILYATIFFSIFFYKYIKFLPLTDFLFAKYFVLLYYKQLIYIAMIKYYIDKWKKTWDIWYFDIKKEFYNIFSQLFKYLSKDEIAELLFFIENPKVEINIKNPFLKQEIVADYKWIIYIQAYDVKKKIDFFEQVKQKNLIYYNLLRNAFEDELQKVKDFLYLLGLIMYIVIVLIVVIMIMPVLFSAM